MKATAGELQRTKPALLLRAADASEGKKAKTPGQRGAFGLRASSMPQMLQSQMPPCDREAPAGSSRFHATITTLDDS